MLEVLYLLTTCSVGTPCPAPLFKRNMEPEVFQYTREVCLTAARTYDADKAPKRAAYCAGNDGSILAASGRVVPDEEYYDAIERYMRTLERTATPAASPSTSAR